MTVRYVLTCIKWNSKGVKRYTRNNMGEYMKNQTGHIKAKNVEKFSIFPWIQLEKKKIYKQFQEQLLWQK